MIAHIAHFVSDLWQIHPFQEGNTRTTAVFTILYLRSIGFAADNDLFANNAWYFRNALVRANYKNARLGVDYSPQYLERFFRNLLLGEKWELKSRYLVINPPAEYAEQPRTDTHISTEQVPEQVPEQVISKNANNQIDISIYEDLQKQLVLAIGFEKRNIRELLNILHLNHRPNFIQYHLRPAMDLGLVVPLYPNNLNHPRQKYLLTVKGIMVLNQLQNQPATDI